jgi:serine/threonine protein phosphatase 1
VKIAVIPDVHGCLGALRTLLKAMGPAGKGRTVVQLGDFIDRGPESRACVELLMRSQASSPGGFVILRGNHEDLCIRSGMDHGALAAWIGNGGGATLRSYGRDFERLCRGDGAHLTWMKGLPLTWEHAGVLFCHAGLSLQNAQAMRTEGLLWDRPPLTRGTHVAVVCGHSPTESGRVEHRQGVFRCDLGLGHREPVELEYLELETGDQALRWTVHRLVGGAKVSGSGM